MSRTGCLGQSYSPGLAPANVYEPPQGPAFLVYYGPAFLQSIADGDRAVRKLSALAEVYRCARELWPATISKAEHAQRVAAEEKARKLEETKAEEERRAAEAKHIAELEEKARQAEEKRIAAEEKTRKLEEARQAEEERRAAEAKRIAAEEEARKLEKAKQAEEERRAAEAKRIAAEEDKARADKVAQRALQEAGRRYKLEAGDLRVTEDVLGDGAYATVKKGFFMRDGEEVKVAVKDFRVHLEAMSVKDQEKIWEEIKTCTKLMQGRTSESKEERDAALRIVGVFGFTTQPLRLVMEDLPNGSLHNLIHSASFKLLGEHQLVLLCFDIALGMRFLHGHRVLHNDLKPANILLDQFYRCTLCDFGMSSIAQTASRTQSKSTGGGTLSYMAPELFNFKPKRSNKSDMYAFSITLYELWSGETPYDGVQDGEVRAGVKDGDRLDLNDIQEPTLPVARALIKEIPNMWHQSPEARPGFENIVKLLRDGSKELAFSHRNFYKAYQQVDARPSTPEDVVELVRSILRVMGAATDQEVDGFLANAKARVERKLDSCPTWPRDAAAWSRYLWTLADPVLKDTELSAWLNRAVREDEGAVCVPLATFCRLLNSTLVQRDVVISQASWPRKQDGTLVDQSHRGCSMSEEAAQWFFKMIPGMYYRVPFFLATSLRKHVAEEFAHRSCTARRIEDPTTTMVEAHFVFNFECNVPGTPLCAHVNFIKESIVDGESEFLFAPYSVFKLTTAEWASEQDWNGWTRHLKITLTTASDNRCPASEGIQLANWH